MANKARSTKVKISGTGILRDALERSAQTIRENIDAAVTSAMVATITPGLTDRQREIFGSLTNEWVRPMDIGGRNSSDHSRVLASLVRKGLVERKGHGSYRYRNPNYVAPPVRPTRFDRAIGFTRVLAGYGCAGVDQEPDATTPCGKCGPCEAAAFLEQYDNRFRVKS